MGASTQGEARAELVTAGSPLPGGSAPQPIVVQKYGGSSVADTAKLGLVAQRIVKTRDQGYRVCVVVSAMGKTTDELLAQALKVSPNPPRRELDMLLSTGERMSMALLSMAIAELGREAISFTGSQSGIITNDRHTGARIIEVRPYRIQDELDRGRIVIVAGYQGVSYKREVTTLGRGGSDTTAVALAAALGAEYCEICSDVDGVYSADPRVVGADKIAKLAALTYDEMQELAESGAKVLNAQAVEFARLANVTISARSTFGPGQGTQVNSEGETRRGLAIKGVTGDPKVVRLRLRTSEAANETLAQSFRALATALEDEQVPMRRAQVGQGSVAVMLSLENLHDRERVFGRLRERFGAALIIDEDLAEVSMVGSGLGQDNRAALDAVAAAETAGATVHQLETSPLRIGILVDRPHVDDVVRAWHRRFVELASEP